MNLIEDELASSIAERFARLKSESFDGIESEEDVKYAVIRPLLQDLGWRTDDPREVKAEYSSGSGRVDYALLAVSKPLVFLEAKKISEDLKSHQEQLLNYAFHEGVGIAVLTNGKSWEFYLPMEKGSWTERKVYSIEIAHQDETEAANHLVGLLAKSNVASGDAELYAKELHKAHRRRAAIEAALPRAWEKLIAEPDDILVDLLAKETESICGFKPDGQQVKDFLKQAAEPPAPPPAFTTKPASREGQESPGRVRGGITQRELEPFILVALLELRGSARNRNVKQQVKQKVESRLTEVDYSIDKQGRVRWSLYCDWARNSLAERGLIKRNSPWGVWELTEEGTREAQRIADRLNRN